MGVSILSTCVYFQFPFFSLLLGLFYSDSSQIIAYHPGKLFAHVFPVIISNPGQKHQMMEYVDLRPCLASM